MTYAVKEIYYTLQGEGFHTGRPAVLLRFAGCNLWSGREADRAGAVCRFCDTDFVGGDRFAGADELAAAVAARWPGGGATDSPRYVICTGGEPTLQLDGRLIAALHAANFEIAIETNGTRPVPGGVDWICVSPKAEAELVQRRGHELKLVYRQDGPGGDPARYAGLAFTHFFLQPLDGPDRERHTRLAGEYCAAHPPWQLSLQTHKLLGIP